MAGVKKILGEEETVIAVPQSIYFELVTIKTIHGKRLREIYGARKPSIALVLRYLLDKYYETEEGKRIREKVAALRNEDVDER